MDTMRGKRFTVGVVAALLLASAAAGIVRAGGVYRREEQEPARRVSSLDRLLPDARELRGLGLDPDPRRSGRFPNLSRGPLSRRQGLLLHQMDYWKIREGDILNILKIGVARFARPAQAERAAISMVRSMQRVPRRGLHTEFPARVWWRGEAPEQIIFVERNVLVKVQMFPRIKDNWEVTKDVGRLVLNKISPPAPEPQKPEEDEETGEAGARGAGVDEEEEETLDPGSNSSATDEAD